MKPATSRAWRSRPPRVQGGARLAAAVMLISVLTGCGSAQQPQPQPQTRPQPQPAPPAALLAEARPIGRGPAFQPPVSGPVLGRCARRLGRRTGAHVEVFAANRVVLIPAGIGTEPPRRFFSGRISGAACYGELVTLDPTGLVLIRTGTRPRLGDLFRSWGQPLSSRRAGLFSAATGGGVQVFVDGRRWPGAPSRVPLRPHAEIVLEVGPYVPPHAAYTFPAGT